MSTLTENLELVKHAAGYEGWADDMNANLDKIDAIPTGLLRSNYLINGGLREWARGTSFTANCLFTADRWFFVHYTGEGSITRMGFTPGQTDVPGNPKYYMRCNFASNGVMCIDQRIEDVNTLAGERVSGSFWTRANESVPLDAVILEQNFGTGGSDTVYTYATTDATTIDNTWRKITFTADLPGIAGKTIGVNSRLKAAFYFGSYGSYVDLAQFQLNKGNYPYPFSEREPAIEKLLCQRYYQTETMLHRTLGSGTTHYICEWIPFKVTMRAAPTCVVMGDLTDGATFTSWDSALPMSDGIFISKLIQNTEGFLDIDGFTADAELY